ncbi:MAG: hypothetical protein EBT86_08385 [Actinobacteria bacterium]|nr:hypothetical protein [Actinomycetota bacterium]
MKMVTLYLVPKRFQDLPQLFTRFFLVWPKPVGIFKKMFGNQAVNFPRELLCEGLMMWFK